jgi:hypothetical protein
MGPKLAPLLEPGGGGDDDEWDLWDSDHLWCVWAWC